MASFQKFREKLKDKESPEHVALLKHVKGLIDSSRSEMSKSYTTWDSNDAVFRSQRAIDKEDRSARDKGQPAKMIVALTFSQIMTFVSFSVMSLMQNKRFFELEPTGSEDNPLREPIELILERDTRKNKWTSFLVQFFLDIGKFSLGCAEICYEENKRMVRVPQTKEQDSAFGGTIKTEKVQWTAVPTFTGNRVVPISPYRFYPDVANGLPLTRYQEGEFCGSADFWSMSSLKSMGDDVLFNLDKIPKMGKTDVDSRKTITRGDWSGFEVRQNGNMGDGDGDKDGSTMVKKGTVLVNKIVVDIVPKNFGENEEGVEGLGDEDFPVRYLCWYANDGTIIRFEEAYYLHMQFPYIAAQFLPDQHKTINEGLADVCDQITTLITWLINAHVTSVRSNIESKFIVDPAGIDMKSLESRGPYIYLKKNASQTGIDRYIKQFATTDVTQNFMPDSMQLKALLEGITSFSAQMNGQYSEGRRSATQDRVVAQGATMRPKMHLSSIWDEAFEPCAKQFIANNRQEMDFETFSRILGTKPSNQMNPDTGVPFTVKELYALFHADPVTIASAEDFFTFDATMPSEKAYLAQSLQEILMAMMSNPQIAGVMGYGPPQFQQLFNDIYNLRGVTSSILPAPSLPVPMQGSVPGETAPNVLSMPTVPSTAQV